MVRKSHEYIHEVRRTLCHSVTEAGRSETEAGFDDSRPCVLFKP